MSVSGDFPGVLLNGAAEPRGSGVQNPEAEGKSVKCDICDEEFANSVELEKHKEREHPMGHDDDQLEKPDLMPEDSLPAPVVPGKSG
jgi:hypothetical protein